MTPLFTISDLMPTFDERFAKMAFDYEDIIQQERAAHINEIVRRCMTDQPEIRIIRTVKTHTCRSLKVIQGGL